MTWPIESINWSKDKPLKISLVIGGIGLFFTLWIIVGRYTNWDWAKENLNGLSVFCNVYGYVAILGMAFGAMNFNAHKKLSTAAFLVNLFVYLLK